MLKVQKIRDLLTDIVPYLKINPEALMTFVSKGFILAAPSKSASFEYNFTVEIIIVDYAAHPDTIIVPLIIWLMENQPEQFANQDKRRNALRFELEYLDMKTFDLFITLELTERVIVTQEDSGIHAKHLPEPVFDENTNLNWRFQPFEHVFNNVGNENE